MFQYFALLPFTICLFWFIYFSYKHNKQIKANNYLIPFFLCCCILYACHIVYFTNIEALTPFSDYVYLFCNQAVSPLYLLYILKLTSNNIDYKKYSLTLLPAVILPVLFYITNTLEPTTDHNTIQLINIEQWKTLKFTTESFITLCFTINLLILIIQAYRHIKTYRKKIFQFYSNTESKDIKDINNLTIVFVATSFISIISRIIGRHNFETWQYGILLIAITYSCLLFLVGYYGAKQEFSITELANDENILNKLQNKKNYTITEILTKLTDLLEKDKLYQNPELSIITISKKIGVNHSYISNIIKQELNITFNELVNKYRIEHAQKLLTENNSKSLDQIAQESGLKNETRLTKKLKETS